VKYNCGKSTSDTCTCSEFVRHFVHESLNYFNTCFGSSSKLNLMMMIIMMMMMKMIIIIIIIKKVVYSAIY
jgi:hypothetical protein